MVVDRYDLLLVSDETYDHILYDARRHISAAEYGAIGDRTILLNTVSKTFAVTGWRIGYLAGREELVRDPALPSGRTPRPCAGAGGSRCWRRSRSVAT